MLPPDPWAKLHFGSRQPRHEFQAQFSGLTVDPACVVSSIRFEHQKYMRKRTRLIWRIHGLAVVDLWACITYAITDVRDGAQLSHSDSRTAVIHGPCSPCVSAHTTQSYIHSRCEGPRSSCAVGTHPCTETAAQPLMGARLRGGGDIHHFDHADGVGGGLATPPPWVMVAVVASQHHHHG